MKKITYERQNHEVRVRLTISEHNIIKKNAAELGMLPSAYLRFLGLSAEIKVSGEV